MSARKNPTAILFALDSVQFCSARHTGPPTTVPYPTNIDWSDNQAIGVWLAAQLKDTGLTSKDAIVVLQRREFAVRNLTFNAVPDIQHDLPGMVELQLQDDTAATRGSVTDFIHTQHNQPSPTPQSEASSRQSTTPIRVFAAALPQVRLDAIKSTIEAAGLHLRAVTTLAPSVLAAQPEHTDTLLIAQSAGGIEITATDSTGVPTIHRWLATTGSTHDAATIAEQFQRMLVMQQIDAAQLPPHIVAIPNDPDDADHFQAVIAQTLNKPTEPMSGKAASPLALAARNPAIDFLNPTTPPDRAAKRRQYTLAAILALIVIAGAGYTVANRIVSHQQQQLDLLRAELEQAERTRSERVRLAAVSEHTQRWLRAGIDPTAETHRLIARLPDHQRLFLTELNLVTDPFIAYQRERRESRYRIDRWRSASPLRADVRGAAVAQQDIYDAWRTLLAPGDISVDPLTADGVTSNIERYPRKFEVRVEGTALETPTPQRPDANEPVAEPDPQDDTDSAEAKP